MRQSSDLFAVDDPAVVSLLRRIRASACEGVRVAELLRPQDGSRRSMEMKFRRYLNRSIEDEIRRCRLQHARELLVGTSLSIEAVAEKCGFANTPHFSRLFKASQGLSQMRYRARFKQP